MTLQNTGFKFFAKIMKESCVFCCSSYIRFNPTSHLKSINIVLTEPDLSKLLCHDCDSRKNACCGEWVFRNTTNFFKTFPK